VDNEQRIKKLYCKWCPREDECKENLTEEEMMGCLACGGFADDFNTFFPQGDGGLLTIDEERIRRQEWERLDPDTRPSWRDYWLKAQRDLTTWDERERIIKWLDKHLQLHVLGKLEEYFWGLTAKQWQALKSGITGSSQDGK